jgi:hypothetical protein
MPDAMPDGFARRGVRAPELSSSCVPRRNRSIPLDMAGEVAVHNTHKGNTAVMRLRFLRRRPQRPRPPLRPKTDLGPIAPTTHSPGSMLPVPSRLRLPPRLDHSVSVSCHHPELTA